MTIDDLLRRVPHYRRFFTVDELYGQARGAAERHPGLVQYSVVGQSTDGEDIPMVTIGSGEIGVMLVALPHPNEPIGATLIHFLVDELIANPALRDGAAWFLLPCVDPDGTRLNEGWFPGPFTIRNYARHFYRPRPQEQVEWTFPISYKTFRWQTPMPETQALMNAIELARPSVLYSLHNAGFGGAYYYISRDLTEVYPTLWRLPTERGLSLAQGEPEMPWAVRFATAVYRVPRSTDAYDYHEKYGSGDPAALMTGGASSFEFAEAISSPLTLVTELPYFQSPQVADTTPIGAARGEVVLAGVERGREVFHTLAGLLARTQEEMTGTSRFWRAVSAFTEWGLKLLDSQERWAQEGEGMGERATIAQRADSLYVATFYRVLIAGMLDRAFGDRLRLGSSPVVERAQADLRRHIDAWIGDIEANLQYSAIPIRDLVQIQFGALLAVLQRR